MGCKKPWPGVLLLGVLLWGCLAVPRYAAEGLTLATWNIENLTLRGKERYTAEDMEGLAAVIRHSGAELLALQEIEGPAPLRWLTLHHLPGWRYAGNDTGSRQDLFFLWNARTVELREGPAPRMASATFLWHGKILRLFDRPPLVAVFRDRVSRRTISVVNLHLKSGSTRGKADRQGADAYNQAKRAAQMEHVNDLTASLPGPVFVMGDFNADPIEGATFPILTLKDGFSYDNLQSNLDAIGFRSIAPQNSWRLREVEGALPRRSTKRREHPDHDLVALDLGEFSRSISSDPEL